MATLNPTLSGAAQNLFAGTVTPSSGTWTHSGTFTGVSGSYMMFVAQYWSTTATVADQISPVLLQIGSTQFEPQAVNTAVDAAGADFSTIAVWIIPNIYTGSGNAWTVTGVGAIGTVGTRLLAVSCVGIINAAGFQAYATFTNNGTTTGITVAPDFSTGDGLLFFLNGGSTTFTATGEAIIPNATYSDTPAVVSAAPYAASFQTGTGSNTITTGNTLSFTVPTAAATTSAQVLVVVLAQDFASADPRVPAVYDVQIDDQVYLVDYSQPFYRQFSEQLDTITRTQADGGATTGENSMDPKGLWRRSQEDWRMGAGQTWLDRKQSDNQNSLPNGFDYSKGMELSTAWQGTLLNNVVSNKIGPVSFATPKMITMQTVRGPASAAPGVIVYCNTTTTLQAVGMTSAGTTSSTLLWTAPSGTIIDFCTDGFNVYVATTAGVYVYQPVFTGTNGSGGTTTLIGSGTLDAWAKVGYFNGRLILVDKGVIWNITSTTAAALGTTNTGVNPRVYVAGQSSTWFTAVAGGLAGIYVISNTVDSGGTYTGAGQVWLITMGSDGLQLNPPQLAGAVTAEESIYSALYYLNNIILYTGRGVRCCAVNSDGSVTLGSLIVPPGELVGKAARNTWSATGGQVPVSWHLDMCASGNFVYFPLTNWDLDPTQATTANPSGIMCTGTGRIDLSNFVVASLQPAFQTYVFNGSPVNNTYAPSLEPPNTGTPESGLAMACTLIPWQWETTNSWNVQPGGVAFCYVTDGQAGITTAGESVFCFEIQQPVECGFFTSGKIAYDLVDNKVLGALDIQGHNFQGIYSAIAVDDGAYAEIENDIGVAGTANLTFPLNNTGSHFEVTIGLTSPNLAASNSPTIIRWTLRAYPAPSRPIQWTLPIILNEDLGNLTGQANGYDVRAQLETLYNLVNTGKQVTFRRGVETFVAFLSDISFLPDTPSENGNTLRSFFNGMCYVTINSLPAWQTTLSAG